MTRVRTLEPIAEALEQVQRHWQERRRDAAARAQTEIATAPTIAIAREAGAPGTSVAREVGERLGWPVYDHELLERIAQEMGLRTKLLEQIDERRQSWLLEVMEAWILSPHVSGSGYVRHLVQTILSLGIHGQCVIVGRGAAHILPVSTTLRVRLTGTREDRIEATMGRRGMSHDEASRWVDATDRERADFIKEYFGKDVRNPDSYDLILNSSRWSVLACAELIVDAFRRWSVS